MGPSQDITKEHLLNLIEIFCSIQGESSFSGLPTTFIRLAQCNLRCSWCDTSYSFKRGEPTPLTSIIEKVEESGFQHVCITGGEPLLQKNVYPLMEKLCDKGKTVSIETGGSLSIKEIDPRVHIILDIKCPGSGMSEKNHWENLSLLRPHDEIKFVIKDRSDYEWAKAVCKREKLTHNLFFSPVHGVMDNQELVSWILEDRLPFRLNLQIHKYIWHPEMKGV